MFGLWEETPSKEEEEEVVAEEGSCCWLLVGKRLHRAAD